MKPNAFRYLRPANLGEALKLMQEKKDDVVILAGGQSLIPMMNMRLINSSTVVDLSALSELVGITNYEDKIKIGAMTRYTELKKSNIIKEYCPLLCDAIEYVAHAAVRNRGTVGGTLALSHPSAELPGCFVALNAEVVIESVIHGRRKMNVEEFIQGMMTTKIATDEIITGIEIPKSNNVKHWFGEVSRRQGDFCIAAVAINATKENNSQENVRIVVIGASNKPIRMTGIELRMSNGEYDISSKNIADELKDKIEFIDDIFNSADGKSHITTELLLEGVKRFKNMH